MNGSGTRSSLMYETIRIVEKLKPKYVIWENVKNLLSKKHKHNFDNYLDKMTELGYKNYYQVLNAKDYGIPQNRERVFTISIRNDIEKEFVFPEKQELKLRLKDMLEPQVDEKYYLSNKMCKYITSEDDKYKVNKELLVANRDIACSKTTREGNTRADTSDYIIQNENQTNIKLEQVIRDGGLYGNKQAGSIYNKEGLCPTITTEASANWNILTMTTRPDILGYVEEQVGLYDNTSSENFAHGQRDKGFRDIYGTLKCQPKYAIYKSTDKMLQQPTRTTNTSGLRIRKLTPKECWRLMGFNVEEFSKAEKVNSNAQLYKQARQLNLRTSFSKNFR